MAHRTGNLSDTERTVSALLGLSLAVLTLRRGSALGRTLAGAAAAGLLSRAFAGHCGIKAAMTGHASLREGMADQWRRMSEAGLSSRHGLPGSPAHASKSDSVDEAVDESFPASDPPASRLPDEPPSNAEAKWQTARAADAGRS